MDPSFRNEIDETIRKLWTLFRNQSELTSEADLDLWSAVTKHPAIQGRLQAALRCPESLDGKPCVKTGDHTMHDWRRSP